MKDYKVYLFFVLAFFVSCNKEGAGCFDKAGNVKTVLVDVPAFTSIDVNTNVDVKILPDGADRVEINTGENLIAGISLIVEDGVLKIDNFNTCFWSIGYTHPLVSIRNPKLVKIIQHGYGRIFSADTIKTGNLMLQVEDASGEINLLIDAGTIRLVSNALGPITLKGRTTNLFASHAWGDGILYAKELAVNDCKISQSGSNRMELNVMNNLQGSINNFGDVYLFGQEPNSIAIDFTSQGVIVEKY